MDINVNVKAIRRSDPNDLTASTMELLRKQLTLLEQNTSRIYST